MKVLRERRAPRTQSMQCVTFRAGELELAIEAAHVQEVLRAPAVTSVPLAPRTVAGLIPLRGMIVTAIDIRRVFGLDASPSDAALFQIVLSGERAGTSLLVDTIGDVLTVDDQCFAPLPEAISPELRSHLSGILRMPDRLLLLLHIDNVLATTRVPNQTLSQPLS